MVNWTAFVEIIAIIFGLGALIGGTIYYFMYVKDNKED